MTELEKQLLSALEQLQQDYAQRLKEWEHAFAGLRKMYSVTQQNNETLKKQIMQLTQQVQDLSGQTARLSQLYSANRRSGMR
ncbi:MbeD family mobilization/exclusion protein [Shigella boydii]|uniref:MbeD/MobD like family protein n=1 Tax=Shigella boydii 4444-74 TaxID=766140 RepID=I6EZ85_SHIBO|nr:MbeD family mobilization/exclusion protein [Shigella boydii]EIQ49327.1 mbeD/MobD like family protein [Shigella boydii 4444-74]